MKRDKINEYFIYNIEQLIMLSFSNSISTIEFLTKIKMYYLDYKRSIEMIDKK